jgi:hypothetical protein
MLRELEERSTASDLREQSCAAFRLALGFFFCSPVASARIAGGKSEGATTSDEGKTGNCRRAHERDQWKMVARAG